MESPGSWRRAEAIIDAAQTQYRIDTATEKVDKLLEMPWAEVNTDIVWAFGSLWVTNFNNDTVWRVNTSA